LSLVSSALINIFLWLCLTGENGSKSTCKSHSISHFTAGDSFKMPLSPIYCSQQQFMPTFKEFTYCREVHESDILTLSNGRYVSMLIAFFGHVTKRSKIFPCRNLQIEKHQRKHFQHSSGSPFLIAAVKKVRCKTPFPPLAPISPPQNSIPNLFIVCLPLFQCVLFSG
jgi:hypothetical protein